MGDSEGPAGRLREAGVGELPVVLRRLAQHLPATIMICGQLDNLMRGLPTGEPKTRVYVCAGSSLVVVMPACSAKILPQSITAWWDMGGEEDEDVVRLLASLPGMSWTKPVYWYACPIPVLNKLNALLNHASLAGGVQRTVLRIEGHVYTLAREDLQPHKVSDGYVLDTLGAKDVPRVQEYWKYNFSESDEGISALVTSLPSVGAYKVAEGGSRELVSWIHLYKSGAMGNTFTLPEWRRKGLAAATTLSQAKQVLDEGRRAFVCIMDDNYSSISFHLKLGFKVSTDMGWHLNLPEGESLSNYTGDLT